MEATHTIQACRLAGVENEAKDDKHSCWQRKDAQRFRYPRLLFINLQQTWSDTTSLLPSQKILPAFYTMTLCNKPRYFVIVVKLCHTEPCFYLVWQQMELTKEFTTVQRFKGFCEIPIESV